MALFQVALFQATSSSVLFFEEADAGYMHFAYERDIDIWCGQIWHEIARLKQWVINHFTRLHWNFESAYSHTQHNRRYEIIEWCISSLSCVFCKRGVKTKG